MEGLFEGMGWMMFRRIMESKGIIIDVEQKGRQISMQISFPNHIVRLTGEAYEKKELAAKAGGQKTT